MQANVREIASASMLEAVADRRGDRPFSRLFRAGLCSAALFGVAAMSVSPAIAGDDTLVQPPVCSAKTAAQLPGICEVIPLGDGKNEVKLNLTAANAEVSIGGYKVVTQNYNGNYLAPVVEAMPGDTVSAYLANKLLPLQGSAPMAHGAHAAMGSATAGNPTNLHYFHGGIVSPNNARPKDAEKGNGDNVYVVLPAGNDTDGNANGFNYKVPIPGEGDTGIDARVLELDQVSKIPHPIGLNWYHSHLHGISAGQVAGGMSGLLSVGEPDGNLKACVTDPADPKKCLNDSERDTRDLKARTDVVYGVLRDIALQVTKQPDQANGDVATLHPDFDHLRFGIGTVCGVWKPDGSDLDETAALRKGFCQRPPDPAKPHVPGPTVLFTLNGQRFPTITIQGNRNLLLRLGNLSANFPYWLELTNVDTGKVLPMTLLSVDGVVPALPTPPGAIEKPVQALDNDNFLLMPASRAEIYLRNDQQDDNWDHSKKQTFILRTKRQLIRVGSSNGDEWPEVQLATVVLMPNTAASPTKLALNAPQATAGPPSLLAKALIQEDTTLPPGCVRDLKHADHEFRRVTFAGLDNPAPGGPIWGILTQIVKPDLTGAAQKQSRYPADPTAIVGRPNGSAVPFEDFVLPGGLVDWANKDRTHVCVEIDHAGHVDSHMQLWVLFNNTTTLHNFHIHQMKFRLATRDELQRGYNLALPTSAQTCADPKTCTAPNYELFDESPLNSDPGGTRHWHDTIPVPPLATVYIVMSFDTPQQIGRFVYHCHILAHEDKGLMAPIEVWEPTPIALQ